MKANPMKSFNSSQENSVDASKAYFVKANISKTISRFW